MIFRCLSRCLGQQIILGSYEQSLPEIFSGVERESLFS